MNILIPTAGNRDNIIKEFKKLTLVNKVISTEIDHLAPGIYYADKVYKVPKTLSNDYIPAIKKICEKEKIDLIIPLSDLDLYIFSRNKNIFENMNIKVLINDISTIDLTFDKYETYNFFIKNNIPTPKTFLLSEYEKINISYPIILKTRFAQMKSTNNYFIKSLEDEIDLEYSLKKINNYENYILQESLSNGQEVNVDFFVQNNKLKRLVCTERLKAGVGGGIIRGKVIPCFGKIREYVEVMIEKLKFDGPANCQLYYFNKNDIFFTEINPRFANSSALTVVHTGINFFELAIKKILGYDIDEYFGKYESFWVTTGHKSIIIKENTLEKI